MRVQKRDQLSCPEATATTSGHHLFLWTVQVAINFISAHSYKSRNLCASMNLSLNLNGMHIRRGGHGAFLSSYLIRMHALQTRRTVFPLTRLSPYRGCPLLQRIIRRFQGIVAPPL